MLERIARGEVPQRPHTVFRGPSIEGIPGALRHEECITRRGFDGPYTIAYHLHRPHEARPVDAHGSIVRPEAAPPQGPPLLRRHYRSTDVASSGSQLFARRPLLFNEDVVLSVLRPSESCSTYFVNADADDLYFVQEGGGALRSLFGDVRFSSGDYVCVPRGIVHRFDLDAGARQLWFLMECTDGVAVPAQYRNGIGQLRMDAPYSHRDFRVPTFEGPKDEGLRRMLVKRQGGLHGFEHAHSPLDVVGYDGTLYPWAFAIRDFHPKVGRTHLPPTVHGTFVTRGALVCSFVPRLLDFDPDAIPCPYPHSSVDVDEVIFYSEGNFTSRRGVGPGSISYHPAGIAHGPHPGAYEGSIGAKSTDEIAVMLDCARPLTSTGYALGVEDAEYHLSFVTR